MKKEKKVTWNDLKNATPQELQNTYKLTGRQLEQAVQHHIDGASSTEARAIYEMTYNKRK